jgi:hypothetical protein
VGWFSRFFTSPFICDKGERICAIGIARQQQVTSFSNSAAARQKSVHDNRAP